MQALKEMEVSLKDLTLRELKLMRCKVVWPSASRAWELLNGVKLGADSAPVPQSYSPDRQKRQADDAFGQDKGSDYLPFSGPFESKEQNNDHENGVQDLSTRIMAHMLGLDIPGIEPSTSYYAGYEWWPRQNSEGTHGPQPLATATATSSMNVLPVPSSGDLSSNTLRPVGGWGRDTGAAAPGGYNYNNYNQYGL